MFKRLPPVVLMAALCSGCSLMFVDGPPKIRPGAPMPATADCTTTSTMPIVDIIFGISSVMLITEVLEEDDDLNSGHVAMFAYPVGLFGSSVQGFRRISACKEFLATPMDPRRDTTELSELWSRPTSFGGPPPLLARPAPPEAPKDGRRD